MNWALSLFSAVWTLTSGLSVYAQAANRLGLGDLGLVIYSALAAFTPVADRVIAAFGSWHGPLTAAEGDVVRTVILFGGLAIAAFWIRRRRLGIGRLIVDASRPTPIATMIAVLLLFTFGFTVFDQFTHVRWDVGLAPQWILRAYLAMLLLATPFIFLQRLRKVWPHRDGIGRVFVWATMVGLVGCLVLWITLVLDSPPLIGFGFLTVYAAMSAVLLLAPQLYVTLGMIIALAGAADFAIWAHRFAHG